jgi:hypothetical protein
MVAQLAVAIFLALVIIFVPYFIGNWIKYPHPDTNHFEKWFIGFVMSFLTVVLIATLIIGVSILWDCAGKIIGN